MLDLSYSSIDDLGLSMICRSLSRLQTLILRGLPNVSVESMAAIGDVRTLERLDISLSYRMAKSEDAFYPLRQLRLSHLLLNGLPLSNGHIRSFGPMPGLKMLSL
jgi:hypothetical protein